MTGTNSYEVRPRRDGRGVDLISDQLPFGTLWYAGENAAENAASYARFYSRSHPAIIRVFDSLGELIAEHQHAGDFREL
jgi:hypothetical protein